MKRSGLKFALLVIALIFSSCASSSLRVPGETKIILKNLASEYYNIAEGYMEIKNYTKAAEYYKLAMRNEDLFLAANYKLARCYVFAKDWDNAVKNYKFLLELDKDNTLLLASLAYISAMRGDVDDSIMQYKALIEKNPYDENLLESYVTLLINVGRGEDAEASFFVLKEKFPDNKQIANFAQQLNEIVDNFDADKKPDSPADAKGEKAASVSDKKN